MSAIACIVVVGLGNIAKRHRRNFKQQFPHAKIVAVSASGRMPTDQVSDADIVLHSLDAAVAMNPDLVLIASPATYHLQHALPFIEQGKHVLVEKPLAVSAEDCQRIQTIALSSGAFVAVAYCLRYLPSARVVRELLQAGCLGTVFSAHVEVGQYLPDWRPSDYRSSVSANEELGGGALLELSHELDYLQWLLGPQRVLHAVLRNSSMLELPVEEVADLVLQSDSGVITAVHLDFLQSKATRRCAIIGSKARLEWDLIGNRVVVQDRDKITEHYSNPQWDKNGMYLAMLEDFVSGIRGDMKSCASLSEASGVINIINAAKMMAVKGRIL